VRSILSVLVENRAGVLARTAGLFARRGYNIESLAVGETEDATVSRMTIVAQGDERIMEQVEKQLNKQIDVIKVRQLNAENSTRRELALIKVNANTKTRGQITDICAIMKAEVVDLSPTTLTIEIADRPERVKQLLNMVEPYGIVEIVRTGMIAMEKGSAAISLPE
jgi:acetolactate synthase-1/3 small subunit